MATQKGGRGVGGKNSLEKYGKRRRIREYFSPSLCRVAGEEEENCSRVRAKKRGEEGFFTHFLMRQTHMCMDLAWRIYPQCAIFSGSRLARVCALCAWGPVPPGRGKRQN